MHSVAPGRALEPRRVAIISADETALAEIVNVLATEFDTRALPTCADLVPLLSEFPLDALILDIDGQPLSNAETLDFVSQLRRANQDLVLVVITRSEDPTVRTQALEAGADEYLRAPILFSDVKDVVARQLQNRAIAIEMRRLGNKMVGQYSCCDLIGGSESMRRVYDAIVRVAESNTSVVIRGESGTGKELVARAIVALGARSNRPFVSLNCAALPPALIEAELFGHEKGAFTGAHTSRPGQIEMAHTGTLFLDEIATLSPELQSKLLRVLEDRAVQRLGSKTWKKIDFRLLTATHENLEQMVHSGEFREDLYYRIHVVPIFLPPLRERHGDIPLLADHFLRVYCAANGVPLKRLDPEVLAIFEDYAWHGNVRELENVMQRLVLMVRGQVIMPKDLPEPLLYASASSHESLLIPPEGIIFDDEMTRIEAAYLEAALRRTRGNKTAAAALLHINLQRMKYLCRTHGIERVKFQPGVG